MAAEYSTAEGVPDCTTCYIVDDHLGNTRLVLDESANVVSRHDYQPFGAEVPDVNGRTSLWGATDAVNQKFTGKERDLETNFDYFGARYYGYLQGRFTSPDWAASAEAIPYADLTNPQSLNLYTYVRNNPVTNRDPDGHDCTQTTSGWSCSQSMWKEVANILQVKLSAGVGTSAGLSGGAIKGKAEANLIKTEVKAGLGGGNLDVKVESGVKGVAQAGPLGVSGKVGVEASAQNGISGGMSGAATLGGAGFASGVKVDSSGAHVQLGAEKTDEVIGGEIHLGVGIGVELNLTQAKGIINVLGQHASEVTAFAGDQLKGLFSTVSGQSQPNILPSFGGNQ
jgi:RHS repeat-associated protein